MENKNHLTPKDIEVLDLRLADQDFKGLGRQLKMKYGTVKSHFNKARLRLESSGTLQTLIKAGEQNLIDLRSKVITEKTHLLNSLTVREFEILIKSITREGRL